MFRVGWRFRKSKQILPGVRLNINKKSFSLSFGRKGMRYTVNSNGKKTVSAGIPGTGLYYTKSSSGKHVVQNANSEKLTKRKSLNKYAYILALAIVIAYSSFLYATTFIGIIPFFIAIFFFSFSILSLVDGIKKKMALLQKSEGMELSALKREIQDIKVCIIICIIATIFTCIFLHSAKRETDLMRSEAQIQLSDSYAE